MNFINFNEKSGGVKGTVNEHQSYVSRSRNEFQNEIYAMIFNGLQDNEKVMVA